MGIVLKKPSSEQENIYLKHMTDHQWWQNDMNKTRSEMGKPYLTSQDILRYYGQRLICPRCERGAYRHKQKHMARCPHCGWEGRSITIDEYLTKKLYR